MDSAAQLMTDGLGSHPILDLRNVSLEEVATQARDDHDPIQDTVALMIDGGAGQPPVSATMFNSSIG
jgi:hypothetical protein